MKKLMVLMAMTALMATAFATPGVAMVKFDKDDNDRFIVVLVDRGGFDFDFDDQESESGDIETETDISIEGDNNNQCVGALQFGQAGNFSNQQGVQQSFSDGDDLEFDGGEFDFAPENETACDQAVQQSAVASGK